MPCLRDNYAYLVLSPEGQGDCVVVDPSEAEPVIREAERRGLRIRAILNTHHHHDHVGGNLALLERERISVYGHRSDEGRIPGLSHPLEDQEEFEVAGLEFSVRHVPGHTLGAVAYITANVCFSGDTLFCGGCGRMFEGTPEQMNTSLSSGFGTLPSDMQIYCGHEYTEQNLRFALGVLESDELRSRFLDVTEKRKKGAFCASAPLRLELTTNLFLRTSDPELQAVFGTVGDPVSTFARLRSLKDRS